MLTSLLCCVLPGIQKQPQSFTATTVSRVGRSACCDIEDVVLRRAGPARCQPEGPTVTVVVAVTVAIAEIYHNHGRFGVFDSLVRGLLSAYLQPRCFAYKQTRTKAGSSTFTGNNSTQLVPTLTPPRVSPRRTETDDTPNNAHVLLQWDTSLGRTGSINNLQGSTCCQSRRHPCA